MKKRLEFRLSRTYKNTPLVLLPDPREPGAFGFNGWEVEPAELRALAQALLTVAEEAEQQGVSGDRSIDVEWESALR